MKFKRWIAIGIVNALLLCGAFQLFAGNKAAAQSHANNTTNLDDPLSESVYLPLVVNNYPPLPTATFTPTFTPSPSPSPSRTPSPTRTALPSPTPTPTYNPPPICDKKYYLPSGTVSFSEGIGPYIYTTNITETMRVSIVWASAKLSSNNCTISQQVLINNNAVASWYYSNNNTYTVYTDYAAVSPFNVHPGDKISYKASAAGFCTGSITSTANTYYVEVCGDPIP